MGENKYSVGTQWLSNLDYSSIYNTLTSTTTGIYTDYKVTDYTYPINYDDKIEELTKRIELLESKLAKLKELTSVKDIYDVL